MGISIVAAAAVFFVVAGTWLYLIILYNGLVVCGMTVTAPGRTSTYCSNSGTTRFPIWWRR